MVETPFRAAGCVLSALTGGAAHSARFGLPAAER